MKKVFLALLSALLWCWFWIVAFISIVLLLVISLFIPKKWYNPLVKIICSILIYAVLIFPKIKSYPKQDLPSTVIYVANHVSFFDLFLSGNILPGYPRGLELKSHFKKPIYGWFITRFDEIPIDSSSIAALKRSLNVAMHILHNNERSILVMPEGTRTRSGQLGRFRHGAFYLSKASGTPIVPVVYKNLYQLNNANSFIIHPGVLDVRILEPIYPNAFDTEEQMAQHVQSLMANELNNKD